ncbi:MAG: methyl-accepting chemotaxis protein [Spirochaetaceae bacterium]|jgi:methyl-accepting chemotaxis protein|nr:methyl-accepting chemotaxis protein [Spirochaetaceae bacterium]
MGERPSLPPSKLRSLKFRFILTFSVFIGVLCFATSILAIIRIVNVASSIFSAQGMATVTDAAALIDGDAFEALSVSLDEEDPFYEETRLKLLDVKQASSCRYLYTMASKGDGTYFYVIDGSTTPDDEDNFSALGEDEDESAYDDAFRAAWATGTPRAGKIAYEGEEWGWMVSIYVPIRNSAGNMVGVVGCDFAANDLIQSLKTHIFEMAFMALFFLLAGMALMLFFLRPIFNRLKDINIILREISAGEGDLTRRITIKKNDEIGELAGYFNLTLDKIRDLIAAIKSQTANLSGIGNDLASRMEETASAVNKITANIQSIKGQVINQSASVTETGATMEQVTVNINKLNTNVEEQAESVAQSSSAIEEMLANIQSVTSTLMANAKNVQELTDSAEQGRTGLREVSEEIGEIAKESAGILEINSVMQNIASQTNLLSMNAAIEAAHAGEAGRGFAVVADEIRKLAEDSGKQSKTISAVLKKIKAEIDRISVSTNTALERFAAIDNGVKTVSGQEFHIRNAMEEQGQGSQQILEAVSRLNEITMQVKQNSLEMLAGSKEIIMESRHLESVTQEISGGINEMAEGAGLINTAVSGINNISGSNKTCINALAAEVSKFKIGLDR